MLTQGRGEMPLYAPTYRAHAHKCPYTSANAPMRAGEQCPYLSGGGNNPLVFDLSGTE